MLEPIVDHAVVVETRDDLVTVQVGGYSQRHQFSPASLGLKSGHELHLGAKLAHYSDDTWWPVGRALPPPELAATEGEVSDGD